MAVNQQTSERLDFVIKAQTGSKIQFQQDSNMPAEATAKLRQDYLRYCRERVFYLPFSGPEQAPWDDDTAGRLADAIFRPMNQPPSSRS